MRKFLVSILLLTSFSVFSQDILQGEVKPVKFTTHTEKVNDSVYNLVIKATIDKGWHLYSQFSAEGGSLPIEITSEQEGKDFVFNGKAEESKTETKFNEVFGVDETFFSNQAMLKQVVTLKNKDLKEVKLNFYGQACLESCVQIEEYLNYDLSKATTTIEPMPTLAISKTKKDIANATDPNKNKGLWAIFFLSFLGGLAALLTPCVFPMIPMTVSYFLKQSKTKSKGVTNAVVYGLSIVIIYVLIGSLVTAFFGADAMNELSTGALFNLVFFAILLVFAFSFLGAFEIILPSSWGTKVDAGIDKKGGYVGIFLMALALAIVSFSCTLPIVGTALAASASSGGIAPIISMLGFSIALALPFTLFAMFPGWLNAMPKSGGWLNTVKVFLGFLELAFAFKFLSNADLVYDLYWFERELFIVIWIAIAITTAFYLFGWIILPHDDEEPKVSKGRKLLGIVLIIVAAYLVPGLWGAPLHLISGFPPPLKYAESPYGVDASAFFQSELLGRNILILILIILLIIALFYIFKGKIIFRGNHHRIGVWKLMLGIFVLGGVFYLIPGLWGAPVEKLSYLLPQNKTITQTAVTLPEHAHLGPHDIISFDDYAHALAYAKAVGKPLMLDFTGKACVNCRKMEDYVWSDPAVMEVMKNDIVVVSLYVDYKKELPETEQYVSKETGKKIKTVGNKWSEMQTVKYKTNTQPYYVMLNPETEAQINTPYSYNSNVEQFLNWLKEGTGK